MPNTMYNIYRPTGSKPNNTRSMDKRRQVYTFVIIIIIGHIIIIAKQYYFESQTFTYHFKLQLLIHHHAHIYPCFKGLPSQGIPWTEPFLQQDNYLENNHTGEHSMHSEGIYVIKLTYPI